MSTDRKRAEIFPGLEITEDDTVVDVGCGLGDNCVFAGKLGADVIGIEVDPKLIEIIEAKLKATPARSARAILTGVDAATLPLPDAAADVVICTEVVEHTRHPEAFVAELVRIGKPGARYWISVPDPASEGVMAAVSPPGYFLPPGHINVFERDRFASLIEGAGLEIDRNVGVGFYWSIWWILRMAVGSTHCPGASTTPPPIVAKWESIWEELHRFPLGQKAAEAFDKVMPKSQVVIARKPVVARLGSGWAADGSHGAAPGPHRAGAAAPAEGGAAR